MCPLMTGEALNGDGGGKVRGKVREGRQRRQRREGGKVRQG